MCVRRTFPVETTAYRPRVDHAAGKGARVIFYMRRRDGEGRGGFLLMNHGHAIDCLNYIECAGSVIYILTTCRDWYEPCSLEFWGRMSGAKNRAKRTP